MKKSASDITEEALADLEKFVSIQSVSTDKNRFGQIREAVEFLQTQLESLDFTVKLYQISGVPPLVVASKRVSPDAKTIGIYAHYDVQPEDPVDEWNSPPFTLTRRDGKLWGRGVADDKAHVIQTVAAIKQLIEENKLKNNIILFLEGEEEVGSTHFGEFMKRAKKDTFTPDVFYILDMGMYLKNEPEIVYALRGLAFFEITVEIGVRDLHSGVYGNRVYNAATVLADLMAKMKNIRIGRILIPGFYDDVKKIDPAERKLLADTKRSDKETMDEAGTYSVVSVDSLNPSLSTKLYPSLDINGMISGFTGEGTKTVIPRIASAKFSCRLVAYQNPQKIHKLIAQFVDNTLPKGVKYKLVYHDGALPFYTDYNNEYVKKTSEILRQVFGNATRLNRSGGTIGAVSVIQELYNKPIVLTGFTLPDENIHAPNENFDEEMFEKGINALQKIFSM